MTSTVAVEQCFLCGEPASEPALVDSLRRCRACRFHWNTTGPAAPTAGYESDSYWRYFTMAPQLRFEAARRLRWLLSTVQPTTLIEAGSAGGYFLKAARDHGISAEGVESSKVAARFAREQLRVPVRSGRFEQIVLTASVRAVCAFGVLQRVADPREFLRVTSRMLAPDGWLALEVPNVAAAAARRHGAASVAVAPRYHRWHFNPESLTRLLTETGFQIVRSDTVFAAHYLPPRQWPTRGGLTSGWAALRATGSLRTCHPRLGDYIRVVARRREPLAGVITTGVDRW